MKTFGEKHEINAYLGYDYDEYRYWDLSATAYKIFQGAEIISAGADDPTAKGTKSESKNAAIYLNVNYSFDSKYLIQGMVRRDGSSKFGSDKRWATFWSVGAGWNMHKEKFLSQVEWINELKPRVSYGISGNQPGGAYEWATILAILLSMRTKSHSCPTTRVTLTCLGRKQLTSMPVLIFVYSTV